MRGVGEVEGGWRRCVGVDILVVGIQSQVQEQRWATVQSVGEEASALRVRDSGNRRDEDKPWRCAQVAIQGVWCSYRRTETATRTETDDRTTTDRLVRTQPGDMDISRPKATQEWPTQVSAIAMAMASGGPQVRMFPLSVKLIAFMGTAAVMSSGPQQSGRLRTIAPCCGFCHDNTLSLSRVRMAATYIGYVRRL
jgi:hypothetical protein